MIDSRNLREHLREPACIEEVSHGLEMVRGLQWMCGAPRWGGDGSYPDEECPFPPPHNWKHSIEAYVWRTSDD